MRQAKPPAKRKPGRPWVNPVGARPRTLRVTDAEYAKLVAYLEELRAPNPAQKA